MLSVGRNIKEARTRLKLSQLELSQCTEITPAAVCQIEAGKRMPSLLTVVRVASALGVTIDSLVYGEEVGAGEPLLERVADLEAAVANMQGDLFRLKIKDVKYGDANVR